MPLQINSTKTFLALGIMSLACFPIFFLSFRLLAFHTMPFDDYHSAILYFDGKNPDFYLFSPTCYRFVFLALIFAVYKMLPLIPLSQFGEQDLDILRVIQAQCFVAFVFAQAYVWVLYFLLVKKLCIKPISAYATALSAQLLLFWLFSYGADTFFLFYVVLLLFFVEKRVVFFHLLLFSIFVNEKISLLFALFFGCLYVFSWREKGVLQRLLIALFSFGLYLSMKAYLGFSGYENQTDPSLGFERIKACLPYIISIKGLYTNVLPLLLLMFVFYLGKRANVYQKQSYFRSSVIVWLPLLFFALGMFVSTDFTIGRLTMHVVPFYMVVLGLLVSILEEEV